MDQNSALQSLSALSHETRLDAFRLLVRIAPEGLPAGEVGKKLGVVQNTMSAHLAVLARCDLITPHRRGRFIKYTANFKRVRELLLFLMQDCCQGAPEICEPLLETVTCGTSQKG